MGFEFEILPDGGVNEKYQMWLPGGYVEPKNFPFTTKEHEAIFYDVINWLDVKLRELFPNILHDNDKRRKYSLNIALQIHKRIDQTQFIISKKCNKDNWYRDITDYIEAIAISFVFPQVGFPYYVLQVKELIKHSKNLNQLQKKELTNYLSRYIINGNTPDYYGFDLVDSQTNIQFPKREESFSVGFDHLKKIYDQWIDIFPFDLGCFDKDKNYFQQRLLELMSTDIRQNPYTDMTHHTLKSPKELIEFLVETTKEMLHSFNTIEWAKKATFSEIKQQSCKFEDTEHLLKQKSLLGKIGTDELSYVEVVNDWLKNENEYFKRLKERNRELQEHPFVKTETDKGIKTQSAKPFAVCLTCSEDQKQRVIANIRTLSGSVPDGRGWAVVVLALYELRYLILPLKGRNRIYQSLRDEFQINVSDKNFNQYIGSYLNDKGLDSGAIIEKKEIEQLIHEITK